MKLVMWKNLGLDNLQTEQFKFGAPVVRCGLAMVINCMFMHGYRPKSAKKRLLTRLIRVIIIDLNFGLNFSVLNIFIEYFTGEIWKCPG